MTIAERIAALSTVTVDRAERVARAKKERLRPSSPLGPNGKTLVIAADHAARGSLRAGADLLAMANRPELLLRLCAALARPEVNGVLGTADVLEELLLLGALEGKTVYGSMNRGGLIGASFELDDRFTAMRAAAIADSGFDGGKMLLRVDLQDSGSVATMEACARAIDELYERGLLVMLEPFMSTRIDGAVRNELTPESMMRVIGIASALGSSAANTWLKIPVVDDMERVMASSTLPSLILGGEVPHDPHRTYDKWAAALDLPNVNGLVVGRALLYPGNGDYEAAIDTAVSVLDLPSKHQGTSPPRTGGS